MCKRYGSIHELLRMSFLQSAQTKLIEITTRLKQKVQFTPFSNLKSWEDCKATLIGNPLRFICIGDLYHQRECFYSQGSLIRLKAISLWNFMCGICESLARKETQIVGRC